MAYTWIADGGTWKYSLSLVYTSGVKFKTCEVRIHFNLLIATNSPRIRGESAS
jgi:hypothetical protein